MKTQDRMAALFHEAEQVIPSGVNSPVRAFKSVGGSPVFMAKGKGPWLWDENGTRYLDFCASWGPMLFGHAPAALITRVARELRNGTSFGTATAKEVELAFKIRHLYPSMEKLRLVSSGTEAVMSAVRLARGATGRKKIIKIDGGYHGHVDSLLVKAGSGLATFGTADSAGVPEELAALTISIPFNDVTALSEAMQHDGGQVAAVILEPVPANMGVVLPEKNYLARIEELVHAHKALLIFDEVITGFRLSAGGLQQVFGMKPDLTCLGKILGGGFPLAAFGGRKDLMDHLAPKGPVYQAGTLSGNPAAVTAALWMLEQMEKKQPHAALNKRAGVFFKKLQRQITQRGLPVQLNATGSMFTLFFTSTPVTDYRSAKTSDTQRYARFFHSCLEQGLYLAPSQFEANFISTTHTAAHLEKALEIFLTALEAAV